MTAAELEQRAERAVRRGELIVALEHFEAYLAQQPEDERVRQRMESVRALLQPSELVSRRRVEPDQPPAQEEQLSDAERGEMLAGAGRFDEAVAAYGRAVAENPRSELLAERLAELRGLAKPSRPADLASAEKLDIGAAPAAAPPARRSARAAAASFAPLPPPRPLPKDKKAMLEELLSRVRSGRRSA
jgi:tetratricopeptide (TPR) repeat protein